MSTSGSEAAGGRPVRPMVVVGSGECGTTCANTLRAAGWSDGIVLLGEEAEPPYERPPLSKAGLADGGLRPLELAAGVDHLAGRRAVRVDAREHTVHVDDGTRLPYARLLVATGAAPRRAPVGLLPSPHPRVHYLRARHDSVALRDRLRPGSRLVVVGGGLIGLEVASVAAARAASVTVVEAESRVLSRAVPAVVAEAVQERHVSEGVRILCATRVTAVRPDSDGVSVVLSSGAVLACDAVLVCLGATPRTEVAVESGLDTDDGIVVDALLATSAPDVFAAGDCCSVPSPLAGGQRVRLESWRSARSQGQAAALSMLGSGAPYEDVPWFWSDQYDLTLQVAGLPHLAAGAVERRRRDGVVLWFGTDRSGRLVAAAAVGRGNAVAKDLKLAERLIAAGATPARPALADEGHDLKQLVRSHATAGR